MQRIIASLRAINTDDLLADLGEPSKTLPSDVHKFCVALESFIHAGQDAEAVFSAWAAQETPYLSGADIDLLYKLQFIVKILTDCAAERKFRSRSHEEKLVGSLRTAFMVALRKHYATHGGLLTTYLDMLTTMQADNSVGAETRTKIEEARGLLAKWLPPLKAGDDIAVTAADVQELAKLFKELYAQHPSAQTFFLFYSLYETVPLHVEWLQQDSQHLKAQDALIAQLLGQDHLTFISGQVAGLTIDERRAFYLRLFEQFPVYVKTRFNIKQYGDIYQSAFELYCHDIGPLYACIELLMHVRENAPRGTHEYINLSLDKLLAWREQNRSTLTPFAVNHLMATFSTMLNGTAQDRYNLLGFYALHNIPWSDLHRRLQKDANDSLEEQFTTLLTDAPSLSHIPAMIDERFCYRDYAKQHFTRHFCEWQVRNAYQIFLDSHQKPFYQQAALAAVPDDATQSVSDLQQARESYISDQVCRAYIDNLAQYIRTTGWQLGLVGGTPLLGTNKSAPKTVAAIYKLCLDAQQDEKWREHFNEITKLGKNAANSWSISFFGLNRRSQSTKEFYNQFALFYQNGREAQEAVKKRVRDSEHTAADARTSDAKLCRT